ncbi:MAG: ABC transporter ATP-binding protein [bacterium]|nr:ABC transporter ATP-binding protein [bacterium]
MEQAAKHLLEIRGLMKQYGNKNVLNGMKFYVDRGEVLGFLGPNGAGKSTTIRLITGIEAVDQGKILFEGREINENLKSLQQSLGIVPQEIALYNDLSAEQNVSFFCSLYGVRGKGLKERTKEALEFVGLWEHRKERPGKFSGGMKRRLNIACSIAHSPEILIMDEPTVGIDPQSRNHILSAIKELNRRGTTVIYVSHYMEEIDALCSRLVIADQGAVILDCDKETLKREYEKQGISSLEDIFLSITGSSLRDEE